MFYGLFLWSQSQLPGLVNRQCAIENGPVEIVDFPIKNGDVSQSHVSLPEGKMFPNMEPVETGGRENSSFQHPSASARCRRVRQCAS